MGGFLFKYSYSKPLVINLQLSQANCNGIHTRIKITGLDGKGRMSIWRSDKLKVSEVDKQTGSYIHEAQ
jgi:hypothetical protein